MAQIVPAMKGRMGDVDYYMVSMKAAKVIQIVKTPKEIEGWEDLSLEEKYQRDINITRVKKQIAPYLVNNESHFMGSIIVAPMMLDPGSLDDKFEPIKDRLTKELPSLYKETAKNLGFLTLPDEILLVPLDGQHRVKALDFAINGKDGDGRDIPGLRSRTEIGTEDISVLLVDVDVTKARSIFTHVNRYAKPTTAGQNYITSDDDILAVVARKITNDIFEARLVKYTTSTLTTKDEFFTTLATIYNCNSALAQTLPGIDGKKLDTAQLPDEHIQELIESKAFEVWKFLIENIDAYKLALADKSEDGDAQRIEMRADGGTLLSRPVVQEHLFRAFLELTHSPTNLSDDEAAKRLNAIPWDRTDANVKNIWQNVIWTGDSAHGRMITKNRDFAVRFIVYLAHGKFSGENSAESLLEEYQGLFPEGSKPKALPSVVG